MTDKLPPVLNIQEGHRNICEFPCHLCIVWRKRVQSLSKGWEALAISQTSIRSMATKHATNEQSYE